MCIAKTNLLCESKMSFLASWNIPVMQRYYVISILSLRDQVYARLLQVSAMRSQKTLMVTMQTLVNLNTYDYRSSSIIMYSRQCTYCELPNLNKYVYINDRLYICTDSYHKGTHILLMLCLTILSPIAVPPPRGHTCDAPGETNINLL